MSRVKRARKQVTCRKKSKKMAKAAYKENTFTAGIEESAPKGDGVLEGGGSVPRKKQRHSARLESSMLGITSPLIRPIRVSKDSDDAVAPIRCRR